jgi:monofunctional biosynthetic peptidoglycan transglycosylase
MSRKKSAVRKSSSNRFSNIFKIAKKIVLWFFAITFLWVLSGRFFNPPITWLMLQRGVEQKMDGKKWKLEKKWRSFDDLSSNLKYAAMAGEDAHFLQHWGFDLKSIQKAYSKNKAGKPKRGGSTITQQTAKNVFLWPGRSWIRKGFEAYFTALIELLWSKKRIMEVYLNVIEMGDGIYGAEAATQFYYNKPASKLSKRQAALLIAVLPNPRRWTPLRPTAYVYQKQYRILQNMRRIKFLKFE